MNIQEQFKLADDFTQLWKAMIPGCAVPTRTTFLVWVGTYPENIVQIGLNRTALKFADFKKTGRWMSGNDCERYAAATMKHAAERQAQDASNLAATYNKNAPPIAVDCGIMNGGK